MDNLITKQDLIKILSSIEQYYMFNNFRQLQIEIRGIEAKEIILPDFNKDIIQNLFIVDFSEFKKQLFVVYRYILNYITLDLAKSKILALFPESKDKMLNIL